METKEHWVAHDTRRLDQYLTYQEVGLSRAQLQRLIREGSVLLNGAIPKASDGVKIGDHIIVTMQPPTPSKLIPHPIPLHIMYEDQELLVVDKPAGLTVHPSPGHPTDTLVNALLAIYPDLPGIGGQQRPGIVHRLDKDTSGLMMVAKTATAHNSLSQQIKDRRIRKGYFALVSGELTPDEGLIDGPIARDPRHRKRMAIVQEGREARTRYKISERLDGYTLVVVYPETGRTHQIRVHFASLGHPLIGDTVYGGKNPLLSHHFLHAHLLGFRHPVTDVYLEFISHLPKELEKVLGLVKQSRDGSDVSPRVVNSTSEGRSL